MLRNRAIQQILQHFRMLTRKFSANEEKEKHGAQYCVMYFSVVVIKDIKL